MKFEYQYSSVSSSQAMAQLGEIERQCFGGSVNDWQFYWHLIGQENFRILTQENKAIALLAIYHMGQWFGGQQVSMAGIASVGVAPEYRGRGAAKQLLTQTIQELHRQQIPISVLYPATQVLYRQVGYEQGGSYCQWELPTTGILLTERSLNMTPLDLSDRRIFADIYQQQAQINNGNLVRNQGIWQKVFKSPSAGTLYAYLISSLSQPEGYIIFSQEQNKIVIRDWALLTVSAAQRLWTFLADHRSQIKTVTWWGSLVNPFLLLLPEQTAKIVKQTIWMLRIIDLASALTQRGYPLELEAELHLKIQDDLLPANNGRFCLQVSQGQGKIGQGGNGDFAINISYFASIYTGFLTPFQMKQLGYLQTTPEALATATLIFAGDRPWLADFF